MIRWCGPIVLAGICFWTGAVAEDLATAPPLERGDAQAAAPTEANVPSPPSATDEPAAGGNSILGVSLQALSATRERPIFSPSRRPPVAAADPVYVPEPPAVVKPADPEHPSLSLIGTVKGGAQELGIFLSQTNNEVIRLHIGEATDGWTLRSVDRRQTILEKEKQEVTLEIPAPGGDTAPGAPAPQGSQGAEERMPPGLPPRPSAPPQQFGSPRFGGRHYER
jgi:general secretion pathway protein N